MRSRPGRHALAATGISALLAPLAGCGGSGSETATSTARQPVAPPAVTLSAEEQRVWSSQAGADSKTPAGIPTLLYHGIGKAAEFADQADAAYAISIQDFAKQMALLRHAGYHTVTLAQFAAYIAGKPERLPSRPLLITFDDGWASSWVGGDSALKREGFTATIFIDAGRVNSGAAGYLTWDELKAMRASGRWDVQLHAWNGHRFIRYGLGKGDYGAFYAYREEGESLDGWRKRVFGDISEGGAAMHDKFPGEPQPAFAPPYGNYGQEGTNDSAIPRELLAWLLQRYEIVFVQDREMFSTPHEQQPLGRFQVARSTTGGELHSRLVGGR